jgi:hypothetical protein
MKLDSSNKRGQMRLGKLAMEKPEFKKIKSPTMEPVKLNLKGTHFLN